VQAVVLVLASLQQVAVAVDVLSPALAAAIVQAQAAARLLQDALLVRCYPAAAS
jgi:hypothetical protein